MFTDLKTESNPVVGGKYELRKDRKDTLMGVLFTVPHAFTFRGVNGVGNHQDQYDFVDSFGHVLSFCPALPSHGVWNEYLKRID